MPHEDSAEHDRAPERVGTNPICDVGQRRKAIPKIDHRGLRIGAWNFQGLCSNRKALEKGEVLAKNHIDIIGGQESWELDTSKIFVPGYELFGKPREGIKGKRGEGGGGFFVSEPLIDDVCNHYKNVKCNETI